MSTYAMQIDDCAHDNGIQENLYDVAYRQRNIQHSLGSSGLHVEGKGSCKTK